MVEVDLTLLVQMVHFIIAYVLLRVFLWRPIIAYLQNEERHKDLLNQELKKQQTIVEQKEFDVVKVKNEAQQAFARNIPSVRRAPVHAALVKKFTLKEPVLPPESFDHMVSVIVHKVEE